MIYTVVPTVYTNDTWTAGNHNLYIKDNFAAVEAQGEGEETLWIPFGAPNPQPDDPPAGSQLLDYGTLGHRGMPFDPDTDQFLNFLMGMPKRFDGGSCYAQMWWGVYPYIAVSCTIVSAAGTATVTQVAHGYSSNDQILIAGADQADYNGTYNITVSDVDTYTYAVGGGPASPATGTITGQKVGNGSVMWAIAINGLDDGDALGADPVAGVANVADAWVDNTYLHKTSWVEVTPNGSPGDDNIGLEIQVGRDADHGSDTLELRAFLFGVLLRWTANVEMDD